MDVRERKRLIEIRAAARAVEAAITGQPVDNDQLAVLYGADYVELLERNLVMVRDLIERCTLALNE